MYANHAKSVTVYSTRPVQKIFHFYYLQSHLHPYSTIRSVWFYYFIHTGHLFFLPSFIPKDKKMSIILEAWFGLRNLLYRFNKYQLSVLITVPLFVAFLIAQFFGLWYTCNTLPVIGISTISPSSQDFTYYKKYISKNKGNVTVRNLS